MSSIRALKFSVPVLAAMASSATAQEADDESDIQNTINFLSTQILACEVNDRGEEQITLQNGDVIANPDWFHDSFSIAVANLDGSAAIFDPLTSEAIQVSDLCVRTDRIIPPHPNANIETDFSQYDQMCVTSNDITVDAFNRLDGNILFDVGPSHPRFIVFKTMRLF